LFYLLFIGERSPE